MDALRFEVPGFGVDVILIEPGLITTGFADVASGSVAHEDDGPYAHFNKHVSRLTETAYKGPMAKLGAGPEAVANTIAKALKSGRPSPLSGHAQRASDDRPAPVHTGPDLGFDHAHAISDAEVLAASSGSSADRSSLASRATVSAPASSSTPNGPVATATQRTPSAAAHAMSSGVSPITTVRSRACGAPRDPARRRAIAGSAARSSASDPNAP